jgi:hypothetical protein
MQTEKILMFLPSGKPDSPDSQPKTQTYKIKDKFKVQGTLNGKRNNNKILYIFYVGCVINVGKFLAFQVYEIMCGKYGKCHVWEI